MHGAGQIDEWCTGVRPMDTQPCSLLAAGDGWRYVIFPQATSGTRCCRACDVADYCGIVRPDWLKDNSTYEGTREYGGGLGTCGGWMKQGGEENWWWATLADGAPCQYYEGYPTFQDGSN